MRILNLSAPALIPSGRPLRHPDAALPGIDWRFSPGMPPIQPGADSLLRSKSKPES
jgi:hypothetical protein